VFDWGVDVRFRDNFTIKNLVIDGFGVGIRASNTPSFGIITGNTITSNVVDGIFTEGSMSVPNSHGPVEITNNIITLNGRNGISINGGSIDSGDADCSGANHAIVKQNTISGNAVNGLEVFGGAQKICFAENTVKENGFDGFNIGPSPNNILTGNTIYGSNQYGIRIHSSSDYTTISSNTVKHGLGGISCESSDYNTFSGNTIQYNRPDGEGTSNGMSINTCDNSTIENNQITYNSIGIELQSNSITLTSNTVSNNDVKGIRVLGGSGHILTSNTASNNGALSYGYGGGQGILIEANTEVTLTNNVANDNHDYGFYIMSTGNTLSGNTATGNLVKDFGGAGAPAFPPTVTVPSDMTVAALWNNGTSVMSEGTVTVGGNAGAPAPPKSFTRLPVAVFPLSVLPVLII
jgi:parallel beta-helix repeat protein